MLNVNPAFVHMLGCKSARELIGRNLANFYSDSQQWFLLADQFRSLQPFKGMVGEWTKRGRQLCGRASFRSRHQGRAQ